MNPDEFKALSSAAPPGAAAAPDPAEPAPSREPAETQPGAMTGAGAASALAHLINLERLKGPKLEAD